MIFFNYAHPTVSLKRVGDARVFSSAARYRTVLCWPMGWMASLGIHTCVARGIRNFAFCCFYFLSSIGESVLYVEGRSTASHGGKRVCPLYVDLVAVSGEPTAQVLLEGYVRALCRACNQENMAAITGEVCGGL